MVKMLGTSAKKEWLNPNKTEQNNKQKIGKIWNVKNKKQGLFIISK